MTSLTKQIKYWHDSGLKNYQAAKVLFRNKHYDGCLFFVHLSLEKLLKGLVVEKTKKMAPHIHDLAKLANLAKIELTQKQTETMRIVNTFNIAGRYTDAKLAFYQRCTKNYTQKYLDISKELLIWLQKKYPKK